MKGEIHLELQDLQIAYGESQVLWGVDLRVQKGKITTIMGRNGVGKTTTLKGVMGLLKPKRGKVYYEHQNISKWPAYKRARAGIAYVPQGREIIPKLTVHENLLIGLEANPDKKAKIPEDEIYEMFPILKDFRNRPGGNLSGGQQQQLAIARALCGNPGTLLMDEPAEGIQPSIAQDIGEVLIKLAKERKMTILLVEQKFDFARKLSDYFFIMDRGRIIKGGHAEKMDVDELRAYLAV